MFELSEETQRLLNIFADADYGSEFGYNQILHETGCNLRKDRQRVYTVIRHLERDHRRTLVNVRGRGYKVAHPNEHVSSMRTRTGRAQNQIVRAERTANATALDVLNDTETRELADYSIFVSRVKQAFEHQTIWNTKQDDRISVIEQRLGIVPQRTIDGKAEDITD